MTQLLVFQFISQTAVAAVATYMQLLLLNKGYTNSESGIMLAIADIAAIFIPILFSSLSDKLGKRRLILALALASTLAFMWPAGTVPGFLLTMVCLVLGNGSFWACNPLIDSMTSIALKGDMRKYSIARAVGTFGYACTGIIFALIAWPKKDDNVSILIAMTITCSLYAFMSLSMSSTFDSRIDKQASKNSLLHAFRLFSKPFYIMLIAIGLMKTTNCIVDRFLAAYLANELGYSQSFTLLIALGAFSEIVMMLVFGRLLEKGRIRSFDGILIAAIAMIIRMLLYAFAPSLLGTIFAQLTHGLTFGALHVSAINYINKTIPKQHNALAISLYWGLASTFPNTLGCLAGGFIIDSLGYKTLFLSYTIFSLVSCAILAANKKSLIAVPSAL